MQGFAQELGHPIRGRAGCLPLFAHDRGHGTCRTCRRAKLLDDAKQSRFEVRGFRIHGSEALQDATFQLQTDPIGLLIAGPFARPQVTRGQKQKRQIARP
jgi:hypothetical protein